MLSIFFKRILIAIPVLLAVASITFFLIKLAPGGPFDADRQVSPQVLKNLNEAYNLDASNWEQYVDYMSGLFRGDLGPSFRFPGRSVTEMISTGLPVTFELAFYAILIALLLGVFSGVLAALKRNTFLDFIPMAVAMIGICVPTFLMGPLLVLIFGINLEILPVSGWGQLPGDKILPSLTLGFAYAAYIARLSRGGMLEVLNQDFIRTARAKGLTEKMVVINEDEVELIRDRGDSYIYTTLFNEKQLVIAARPVYDRKRGRLINPGVDTLSLIIPTTGQARKGVLTKIMLARVIQDLPDTKSLGTCM